ncbi:MAG: glycolate oxidase subunit GlcE [Pseudomonadales bacterium]
MSTQRTDHDDADRIQQALVSAAERGRAVRLCGAGSKRQRYPLLGGGQDTLTQPAADLVSVTEHCGITHYAPDELVIEARAGTPLAEIERILAQHHQMLAFEPPRFGGVGTLGGAVAAGLSGPARPWRGSLRDAVLGVEMVNGLGERLNFGGRVVKNVAGYDLSRLQAGAFGTFGALLKVCVRVLPQPVAMLSLALECTAAQALQQMSAWTQQALPLTGSAFEDGVLRIRLQGAPDAVRSSHAALGGEIESDHVLWERLRDYQLPRFAESGAALYRAVLPIGTPAFAADDQALLEWGGAVRWYENPDAELMAQIASAGGWLCPYQQPDLHSTDSATGAIAARLRAAFDPQGICNVHLAPASAAADLPKASTHAH